MNTLEQIKEELIEREEQSMIESIDCYDWLIEHQLENEEQILDNFIRNYKPTYVHSIIQFGDYESGEAKYIIQRIGTEETLRLILENTYIKQDHDVYHEHWNDIASQDWNEYEVQIDIDEDHEHYQLFKDANETSFWGYVSLGMIRLKLDTEKFEHALMALHGFQGHEADAIESEATN